jgi:hypothetical protein
MKGITKDLVLVIVLCISFLVLATNVSAADSNSAGSSFVYSSYSNDGSYAVKSTSDNNIYFFDNSKNAVHWTYNIGSYIGSIAISPDGRYVAVGCAGGLIYLFDQQGNVLWKKTFGDSVISPISFSEDGNHVQATNIFNQIFYFDLDGNLAVWPTSTVVAATPSVTISAIPTVSSSDNALVTTDTNGDSGISIFVWLGLAFIFLLVVVFWIISSSNKKKGTPINPPPHPLPGRIYAETNPKGAAIYVNGIYAGLSPLTIPNILPGIHTVESALSGYDSNTQRITINAGQTVLYSTTLRKLSPPSKKPQTQSESQKQPQKRLSFQDLITQLGAQKPQDREEAQKQLIIKVNTDGKTAIQQIIRELEKQPSVVKREIVNLLYYLSKESLEGQKVTEELILALTYSSSEVKWLIIQTLGRLKDKRALSALEAAVSDTDFLVKYWAIISLKNVRES